MSGVRELVAEVEAKGAIKRMRPQLSFWLRLFVFHQLLTVGFQSWALVRIVQLMRGDRNRDEAFGQVALPYDVLRLALYGVLLMAIVTGLVLVFRRARIAPRYWVVTLMLVLPWRWLEWTAGYLERSALEHVGFAFRGSALDASLSAYLASAATIIAWWGYWMRSASVERIFGARGFDIASRARTGA